MRTSRLGTWLLLGLLGCPVAAVAQGRPDLKAIASRLQLTSAGTVRWLSALGVVRGQPAPERLLAVSAAGEILMTRQGGESSVAFGVALDLRLLDPRAAIVLVHNHPSSAGLSANDLSQLAKPGVSAVVAIGHDGSIYIAVRGPRYRVDDFEAEQYEVARRDVTRRLLIERSAGAVSHVVADAQFSHLAGLALGKAGVIEYPRDPRRCIPGFVRTVPRGVRPHRCGGRRRARGPISRRWSMASVAIFRWPSSRGTRRCSWSCPSSRAAAPCLRPGRAA